MTAWRGARVRMGVVWIDLYLYLGVAACGDASSVAAVGEAGCRGWLWLPWVRLAAVSQAGVPCG